LLAFIFIYIALNTHIEQILYNNFIITEIDKIVFSFYWEK